VAQEERLARAGAAGEEQRVAALREVERVLLLGVQLIDQLLLLLFLLFHT
jgi:hypothetical protein